jgi:DNA topoisomerase-6 subunit B
LKGARLPKQRLKDQLLKIAVKRTGGTRTNEILGHDSGPEGLPHSIIVTAEGPEGEAPEMPPGGPADAEPPEPVESVTSDGTGPHANGVPPRRRSKAAPAAPAKAASAHAAPRRKAR